MSFLGMSRTFLGTALPAIRSSLDLSLVQAGTFTVCLQFGFAGAVFAGGLLSDVFKKSAMLLLGCLLTGVNLLLICLGLMGLGFKGFRMAHSHAMIQQ